ncbi:hypothetical protein SIN04_16755 [Methylocella tundrae]|nr:hypothetical protein SIN04_16755 [Methylocella tundrae]
MIFFLPRQVEVKLSPHVSKKAQIIVPDQDIRHVEDQPPPAMPFAAITSRKKHDLRRAPAPADHTDQPPAKCISIAFALWRTARGAFKFLVTD